MDFSTLSPSRAIDELGGTARGLSFPEVTRRTLEYGSNVLSERHGSSLFSRIVEPFRSLFVVILLLAGVISLAAGQHMDALVIALLVVVNAMIYYIQRFSTDRVLASLRKHNQHMATVIRNGAMSTCPASSLVPGDIVLLAEGQKVPADGRLVQAAALSIDESMLTGESQPVSKTEDTLPQSTALYDRANMVFSGSLVLSGRGQFVVSATGDQTELGHIASLSSTRTSASPLEQQIDKLTNHIVIAISIAMAATLLLALFRGIPFAEAIRFLISLAVSAIPEGLPVALTLVLVIGMKRLAARRALVRRISTIETLGQIELVATDKTGTITQNRLTVAKFIPYLQDKTDLQTIARLSVHHHAADPVETALSDAVGVATTNSDHSQVLNIPFDQKQRMSGNLWTASRGHSLYIKGAVENVVAVCDLPRGSREELLAKARHMSTQGYRVLAFAHLEAAPGTIRFENLHGLEFDGMAAVADEIRPGIAESVQSAHAAGIDVIMLTGDHQGTAATIGMTAGIITDRRQTAEGTSLANTSADQIRRLITKTKVFARVLPEHKYAILEAFHGRKVTAMTGDGVNDVPALTNADVGIAVGRGSDAAKEAADVILLNNDFSTIIEAIRQGRVTLSNVRKMLMYLFATSIGEVTTMVGALIINLPLPVSAIQILWVNLVTDTFAVIPLGLEPPETDEMHRPPVPRHAPILSRRHIVRLVLSAALMALLVITVYKVFLRIDPVSAQTMAFCSLVVIQWSNAIIMRKERAPMLGSRIPVNWLLYTSLAVGATLQILVIFGPLAPVLHTQPLDLQALIMLAIVAAISLTGGEIIKLSTTAGTRR